ncbi:endonuclease domain-containing protein [Novosphingobium sp. FSW06-99]|uniref:endonuclease domain-containing protein n=1 Tax=Novosphingobium sp. FSW06-99 TaxID=1739113 RepID=UPI00076C788C|nr:endonuclease domain-containing protein [Novosphingobium sp. FSW06-99]KUR77727.1 DNA-cytosine methyltransferase [Novosphingobium sp. FSW06-99]
MVGNQRTNIAQRLRANPTEAEKRLWARLKGRQLGAAFTRQCPIGDFVIDFACRSARLAIEIDGGQHADSATDPARARLIEAHGYRVIRFWNNDVLENTDGVIITILQDLAIARNRT